VFTRVPFVFNRVPFVFTRVPFVFTRVHSCSLVFTCVHSCSDSCGVLDQIHVFVAIINSKQLRTIKSLVIIVNLKGYTFFDTYCDTDYCIAVRRFSIKQSIYLLDTQRKRLACPLIVLPWLDCAKLACSRPHPKTLKRFPNFRLFWAVSRLREVKSREFKKQYFRRI
jgi:hypothetical protein